MIDHDDWRKSPAFTAATAKSGQGSPGDQAGGHDHGRVSYLHHHQLQSERHLDVYDSDHFPGGAFDLGNAGRTVHSRYMIALLQAFAHSAAT